MEQVAADEWTAAVASTLEDGEKGRRRLASLSKLRSEFPHWRVEAALILRATVHVYWDALDQSCRIIHQALDAAGHNNETIAELGPDGGKAQHCTASIAHARQDEAAATHGKLLKKMLAELMHVPDAITFRATTLKQWRCAIWSQRDSQDPVAGDEAAAEVVHMSLATTRDAQKEGCRCGFAVPCRPKQLIIHALPVWQLKGTTHHGIIIGDPNTLDELAAA
mmetsp:Transcript_15424/g.39728  ORF Transcript_15424/g.39728 Transcript_15424/m.39728 type:complete len:222 (-) Transcript_15424:3-668(-)